MSIIISILQTTREKSAGWNWETLEALGTLALATVTFITLLVTIYANKKTLKLEKEKFTQLKIDIRSKQRQQTYEAAQSFLQKYLTDDISEAINDIRKNIRDIRYHINDNDLQYLTELQDKGSSLQFYQKKGQSLENIAKSQHNQSQFETKEQAEWYECVKKINEINIWFAERIEGLSKEV